MVCRWTAAFRKKGVSGLTAKKRRRALSAGGAAARKEVPRLLAHEPAEFGIMKGRWTLADISSSLRSAGMAVSLTTVHRIMNELDYTWKRPKLRAPGSIKKDYRKRKEVENYKRIAPALRKNGVLILFEDEKWIELLARIEGKWILKGKEEFVPTPGWTAGWNYFISMDAADGTIIWNSFPGRRNREFRRHLSNVIAHAERLGAKRVMLFVDRASYHDTDEVKAFIRNHPLLEIRHLPKKDPNVNPVELNVNRKMSSFVQCNRCYYSTEELSASGSEFLSHYNSVYAS